MLPTQDIPLISSTHGRERRSQRDISKRDLKAAVKYGTKEKGFPHPRTREMRWKYTYNDIVYITDATSTVEVTSWALELPLSSVSIPESYQTNYQEAKRRLHFHPQSITSHAVILVDMSGSMNKSDMNGHRSRARGVYYNLAECFVAEKLCPVQEGFMGRDCAHTDVVTLIEMRSSATVVFEKEPLSWILYNRFVDLAERRDARDHGNYYPSFCSAFEALRQQFAINPNCGLALFFFTDGKPSDYSTSPWSDFPSNLLNLVASECSLYKSILTLTGFCYGSNAEEFDLVERIVQIARGYGAQAEVSISFKDPLSLETALTKTATSLTATRTQLTRLNSQSSEPRGKSEYTRTSYTLERRIDARDFHIYVNSATSTVVRSELAWLSESLHGEREKFRTDWVSKGFLHPNAAGIAVGKKYFGEGAERIVFAMTEIDAEMRPIGLPLVAKLSLHKHKESSLAYLRKWHRVFAKTQMRANKYASDETR